MTYTDDTIHAIVTDDTSIEAVATTGNLIRVRLATDETYWVAATEKNKLLYNKRIAEVLAGGTRYVLTDDPYRAVATDNFTTFRLWTEGEDAPPLYAPPEYATDIIRAVREHRDAGSTTEFETVVDLLTTEYARPHVVNAVAGAALADEPVRVVTEGWVIRDLFLLTWNGDVFPYSGDDADPTRWDQEDDATPPLYALSSGALADDHPPTLTLDGREYTVNQREQAFLTAARWLLTYEEADEFDTAYWTNVKRAIDRQKVEQR